MGDGGVACMPLQHNIMDRFPIPEKTALCGGNTNANANTTTSTTATTDKNNNGFSSKPVVKKKVMKIKKRIVKRPKVKVGNSNVEAAVKSEVGSVKGEKSDAKEAGNSCGVKEVEKSGGAKEAERSGVKEAENGGGDKEAETCGVREVENVENGEDKKEEVEEGELGTLNGEFVPEKWRRSEIEREETGDEKWRRSEVGKGESFSGKWRRGDAEKADIYPEKSRNSEAEFGSWRPPKDEIERGEYIPDRWQKGELARDDYISRKIPTRYDMGGGRGRGRGWKFESSSGKYPSDDGFRRKEYGRGGGQHSKSTFRWDSGQERNTRISSKIVDDEGVYKNEYGNEYSNSKYQAKEFSSVNRLKRYGPDSNSNERKHYGDYGDYAAGIKSRKLSDESNRSAHSEHYSQRSVERSYRNPSFRVAPDKYSSRHYEPSLSSRVVYERHGRSPGLSERSPRDRSRYYDHLDRSPVRRERSPYDQERSPFGREKSPHGREKSPYFRERSPYVRERSPYVRDKSPYVRDKSPYVRDKSPYARDKSPHGRERSPYGRDRSPYVLEKSPYERNRNFDHRNRSLSPQERPRYHDRRDHTPNYLERSPRDRGRATSNRGTGRKSGASDRRNSQHKVHEDKPVQKVPSGTDSNSSAKECQDKSSVLDINVSVETIANSESQKDELSQSSNINCKETSHISAAPPEELPSMEEDMDICDTPPHVPVIADSSTGKWFYLDYYGVECGPSKLSELKALVEEGALMSDHMVKHSDSDRWLTVENAVSPLITVNFPSIVSDSITGLVSPPEAPGNLLADTGHTGHFGIQSGSFPGLCADFASEPLEDLHIEERVGALMEGLTVIPGRELEAVGEVLQMSFECAQREVWGNTEGLSQGHIGEQNDQKTEEPRYSDIKMKDAAEVGLTVPSDKDALACGDSGDWFSGRWSCKGGDWIRNEEGVQDRSSRKKLVVNNGFPLCQMSKAGYEDPRWHRKDELYYPSQNRRLDLPTWAFSCPDDANRVSQSKPTVIKGVKGTILPVVKINACVVKDHGSFVSEPRIKVRGIERHPSRSARSYSASSDGKRSSGEGDSQMKPVGDRGSKGSSKCISSIKTPKDRIGTVDDLQLHLGDWYYLDGAGHERGPSSFSELQALVDQGVILKHSSVFRKFDKVWVPVTSAIETSNASKKNKEEKNRTSSNSSGQSQSAASAESRTNLSWLQNLHPQFIGYTCGKLHELVMKSYKSREFAAAINEVLDPWINARQPKKELDKHMYWKADGDARTSKRARLLVDECEEDYDAEEDLQRIEKDESTFEDLIGNASFVREDGLSYGSEMASWGLLDGHVLARVFHFLRLDMKSLTIASLTCKHWRAAVSFYKDISRQVDLSSLGPKCTDSMIVNIMSGYGKEKINSMVLIGCTNITPHTLEEILGSLPCLSNIDIRGCNQFGELVIKFQNLNWIKSRSSRGTKMHDDSDSKLKSLKYITEKSSYVSRSKVLGNDMDDFSEMKVYLDSVDKRDSANHSFRGSLYKRSKLFDARRSSSILSRNARMRRLSIKKSENGYKRMEEFVASSLKDIMKENTSDFFVPKVAEIQDKMRNGYYIRRGLSSVKDDISRMCRDAIKAKNRGEAGDMNHIINLFIQLASRLEGASKSSDARDELIKSWEDDTLAGVSSASKSKKKLNKTSERKLRSNGSFVNGSVDNGEYASDQEIRRRLSKLNKKSMDSESETSDDIDRSSEDDKSNSESTASDTESDLESGLQSQPGQSTADGCLDHDEGLDSLTDDREWGARMTKSSLVPPVTRKYEVIHEYVIVSNEEDVKRKMQVSLPKDYVEKLASQKNGTDESDMDIPEVKDYKPRKMLGDEVLEQEVYGIDPYSHNLLLDSMPEEFDWPLLEKHLFIEDVLLRTLNKQVRHFTGTGNTPMIYPLRPVVEDIRITAEEDGDIRTVRMCQGILKAIDGRPDDKYVAYRKGLGVVCNKEEGFGEEDFVVEFLGEVYPVWKWFEKQDGIRSLQKNSKDPAPEFYNIYLERPKGDADGYDLVVVDAMHKANYASRICHSCRPNCEAKVTAVDGRYQIGIYTVRKIQYGEEITFDYNSVTESKEEYEASVCLCGSQVCRGSYLNLTGEEAFLQVLKDWHGIVDRHHLMLEACELNSVSEKDYFDLEMAGLGKCLLEGLPDWAIAYTARLVRFINFERTKLPEVILKHNLEEKRKYFSDIDLEVEKSDARIQAEGVFNQRLQNLAVTLDKVRYVMSSVFGDPKNAPPPLERLTPEEAVTFLWKGEGSLVEELLQSMAPHVEEQLLNDLKSKMLAHDPSGSDDIWKELKRSLLWLRDEVRNLPCTYRSRHDAAADLIHIYAYTRCYIRIREYKPVTSPPVYISPLDLGPKYTNRSGADFQEYCKTYGENYCLGQLMFWYNQSNAEPDCSMARASRGCLSLPEIGSFYAKISKPSRQRVYGPKAVKFMLSRMEKLPQKAWPKDRIWSFNSKPKVLGSPMLDAVVNDSILDKEMVHWLKHRPAIYQAVWDR
uniref:probable histone-lysine N-methyltransferase ATXR3 n=1 Tax=Fragaria vesca subsp. vesca TaxID=101020 RepID=UPI0005CA1B57|nr:PREDICTED: probable histone-lysine N-methyltransferase ATXR3 [Fragaria vesca subsp. vesca]